MSNLKKEKTMKLFRIFAVLLSFGLIFSACNTDKLQELNTDPLAATEDDIDPGFILAYTQLQLSGERYENWRAQLIYQSTMMQVFATLPGYWTGDKYTWNPGYASSLWDRAYSNYVKDLVNLVDLTSPEKVGDNSEINYHAIARIIKAYAFMRLTDLHGDIPYSEAGLGFLENNFAPVYDRQEDIYTGPDGIIAELQAAVALIDDAQPNPGVQDLIFGGNLDLWRKAGNSLLMRAGMRLTKVNPGLAQSTVEAAIAAGVMTSNDDIMKVNHTDGPDGINNNGIGDVFNWNGEGYTNDDSPRLSQTLVTWMQNHNDPRLGRLSWVTASANDQYDPVLAAADAKGMPNGLDVNTILNDPTYVDGDDNQDTYSRVKPDFVLRESPMVFMTYAEACFLQAEAKERGWAGPGDAATWYGLGVEAAMGQYGMLYGSAVEIPASEAADYLTANPYAGGQAGLEQIGEQVWISTMFNFYETFANWRRTGFPALTPVDYPGNVTNGTIPRRMTYSQGEASVNAANYADAVQRLGGNDDLTGRVWWDVQ